MQQFILKVKIHYDQEGHKKNTSTIYIGVEQPIRIF